MKDDGSGFRVKIEGLYPDFAGTNLGDATLEGSLKDRKRVVELHGGAHCTGSEREIFIDNQLVRVH